MRRHYFSMGEREREGIQSRKVCSKNAGQISRDRAHQTKHWPFSSKSSNVARRYFLFSQNWFCYNDSHERMRSVISRKLGIQIVSLLIIYKRHHFAAQVKVYLNILLFLASPLKNPGFGPRPKKNPPCPDVVPSSSIFSGDQSKFHSSKNTNLRREKIRSFLSEPSQD